MDVSPLPIRSKESAPPETGAPEEALAYGLSLLAEAMASRRKISLASIASGILAASAGVITGLLYLIDNTQHHLFWIAAAAFIIAATLLLVPLLLPRPKLISVSRHEAFFALKPWRTNGTLVGSALPSTQQVVHFVTPNQEILKLGEGLLLPPKTLQDETIRNGAASRLLAMLREVKTDNYPWSFIKSNGKLPDQLLDLLKIRHDLVARSNRLQSLTEAEEDLAVSGRLNDEVKTVSRCLDIDEANAECLGRLRSILDTCLVENDKHEEVLNACTSPVLPNDELSPEVERPTWNPEGVRGQIAEVFTKVIQNLENDIAGEVRALSTKKDHESAEISDRVRSSKRRAENEANEVIHELDRKASYLRDDFAAASEDLRHWETEEAKWRKEMDDAKELSEVIEGDNEYRSNYEAYRSKYSAAAQRHESAASRIEALNARAAKLKKERQTAEENLKAEISRMERAAKLDQERLQKALDEELQRKRSHISDVEVKRNALTGLLATATPLGGTQQDPRGVPEAWFLGRPQTAMAVGGDQQEPLALDHSATLIRCIIEKRTSVIPILCGEISEVIGRLEAVSAELHKTLDASVWKREVFDMVRNYLLVPFVCAYTQNGRTEQMHFMVAPVVEDLKSSNHGGILWRVQGLLSTELIAYCRQSYDQKRYHPRFSIQCSVSSDKGAFSEFIQKAASQERMSDKLAYRMLCALGKAASVDPGLKEKQSKRVKGRIKLAVVCMTLLAILAAYLGVKVPVWQKAAEASRVEQEQRLAEDQKASEERRLAEERQIAEEKRASEEQRLREERRIEDERRRAEEARKAEEQRREEEARKQEEERQAAERRRQEEELAQKRAEQEALEKREQVVLSQNIGANQTVSVTIVGRSGTTRKADLQCLSRQVRTGVLGVKKEIWWSQTLAVDGKTVTFPEDWRFPVPRVLRNDPFVAVFELGSVKVYRTDYGMPKALERVNWQGDIGRIPEERRKFAFE